MNAVNTVDQTFEIVVDYDQTLEQMIAAGRYDWVNSDITATRFPVKGEGKKELIGQLIHFNRAMSSEEVKKELDTKGLRPATHEEALAFRAQRSEFQCDEFAVVAIGSFTKIHGSRNVMYIDAIELKRRLDLACLDSDWNGRCRFLAVANAK